MIDEKVIARLRKDSDIILKGVSDIASNESHRFRSGVGKVSRIGSELLEIADYLEFYNKDEAKAESK